MRRFTDRLRLRYAGLGILGLAMACSSGKSGDGDTGSTDDTGACVKGYGTLRYRFVAANEYAASIEDELDGEITFGVFHLTEEPDVVVDCLQYLPVDIVAALKGGLNSFSDQQLPTGWTCLSGGAYFESKLIDSPNYLNVCDSVTTVLSISECERTSVDLYVTCSLVENDTDA